MARSDFERRVHDASQAVTQHMARSDERCPVCATPFLKDGKTCWICKALGAQGLHVVSDADIHMQAIGRAVLDMMVPDDRGGGFYFDDIARRKLWDLCEIARRDTDQ